MQTKPFSNPAFDSVIGSINKEKYTKYQVSRMPTIDLRVTAFLAWLFHFPF